MKLLLLDDEPFELQLLEQQLRRLGFEQILACQDARTGLEQVRAPESGIELIFCDLQMPDIDGVELIRHLRLLGYGGALVLVSGEDERILRSVERLARSHGLHVLGVLCKPIELERLRGVLQHLPGPVEPGIAVSTPARPVAPSYTPAQVAEAIAKGELTNHYQPKVSLRHGVLTGVETLVRWQHPRDGLVAPDRFVPVAERSGQIDALTQVVLAAAMRQAAQWREQGRCFKVAVNISMQSLASLAFADLVMDALSRSQVPPAALVLEVTETALMQDPRVPLDILNRMRLRRVGLSIDDFGTGNASLAQLRDIPFDELKIDRGFVHGASTDRLLRAILGASLGMAKRLGMSCVAEGVEDRADWDFLSALGCTQAQGYFIARPMPAAALQAWEREWQQRCGELIGQHPD